MCPSCVFGSTSEAISIITWRLFTFVGQSTIVAATVQMISSIEHVATIACASLEILVSLARLAKISESRIFENCLTQSVLSLDACITRPDFAWCQVSGYVNLLLSKHTWQEKRRRFFSCRVRDVLSLIRPHILLKLDVTVKHLTWLSKDVCFESRVICHLWLGRL